MNIRDIDLNLLVIFRTLMKTRSVSGAAKELNLSQPAVSHALSRLRQNLSDDLLVRASKSMTPTPYAVELEQTVGDLLERLEMVLVRKVFDPKTAVGKVHIRSTEYFELLIFPRLIEFLSENAPGIQLISTSNQGKLPQSELNQGTCDIAIAGFFGDLPEGLYQQKILKDRLVCLCSSKRPEKSGAKISLADYLKLNHIYISPEGKLSGKIDHILAKQKRSRKVVASISGFSAPAWICRTRNAACTLPEKLAKIYVDLMPLKWVELPFETPAISVVQVWHERTQKDPLLKYIRSVIANLCSTRA